MLLREVPWSVHLLTVFALFAFVTSVTPGPNNTMLLASGVNFRVRRSIPHVVGISAGLFVMVVAVGLGLESVFLAYPSLYTVLRYAGAAYLLYLAWKIATSGPMDDTTDAKGGPFGFWRAAAFQWVNPKAWVMAIGAVSTYLPQRDGASFWTVAMDVVVIALVFALINSPTIAIWAVFGSLLRRFLRDPKWMRVANAGMALLLVVSLSPILSANGVS